MLEEDQEDFDIHVESDVPESDRGRQVASEDSEDQLDTESDQEYSERVRRRISKETAKVHAERRAKEAAIRERDEAVQFARQALEQTHSFKKQANQYEAGYVYKAKQAAEALIEKASADYTEAMTEGNTSKMIEAQRALIRAEQEKAQYEAYTPPVDEPVRQAPPANPAQDAVTRRVDADELKRQTKFIQENPWLNRDPEMTERALNIDAHIRQTNPQLVGTEAYYEFVSTLMRQQFTADRFATSQAASSESRPAQVGVAPVNRGTGQRPTRSVTLTESQVKLCKRLGITPQQYAAQLLKGKN